MNNVCSRKTGLVNWNITNKNENSRFGRVDKTPEEENVGCLMKPKNSASFVTPTLRKHIRANRQPVGHKPASLDSIQTHEKGSIRNKENTEQVISKYSKSE